MAIPVKETKGKIVACAVCGAKLELNKQYHYIARDDGVKGVAAAFTREPEETLYDAFDCPVCGCQYIAQERKRTLFDVVCSDELCDDDEISDKADETSDKEEKPECNGCEYDDDPQNNPFSMMCVSCRRMYTDKYRKKQ